MLTVQFGQKENPLILGSISLNCYVLKDNKRVLTISSIQKALGYDGKSENWATEFIDKLNSFFFINPDLSSAFKNAIIVKITDPKSKTTTFENTVESYYFIALCQVIVRAKEDGFLNIAQLKHAKLALLVLKALEKPTIEDLIDEVTGFTRYKMIILEHFSAIIKKQHNDTIFDWVKTFPLDFMENILTMNSLFWEDIQKQPALVLELLNEIIFSRIENDILETIRKSKPKRTYTRKSGKKQEIEHPNLKEFILILISLLKASGNNWNIFIQLLNKAYPKQKNRPILPFLDTTEKTEKPLSSFNEKLKNSLNK